MVATDDEPPGGGAPLRSGRGVLVYALGVLLVEMDTWVAIVLHVLRVLMVLRVPVAALAGAAMRTGLRSGLWRRLLWAATAAAFVVAPWRPGLSRRSVTACQRRPAAGQRRGRHHGRK